MADEMQAQLVSAYGHSPLWSPSTGLGALGKGRLGAPRRNGFALQSGVVPRRHGRAASPAVRPHHGGHGAGAARVPAYPVPWSTRPGGMDPRSDLPRQRPGLFQDRGPRGGVRADRRAGHVGGGSLGVVLWSRVWPARGPMAAATYRGPHRKAGSRFLKQPWATTPAPRPRARAGYITRGLQGGLTRAPAVENGSPVRQAG